MEFIVPDCIRSPVKMTGSKATQRQRKFKQTLIRSGGRRVSFNLSAAALSNIDAIMARDGLKTGLEAVQAALAAHAA